MHVVSTKPFVNDFDIVSKVKEFGVQFGFDFYSIGRWLNHESVGDKTASIQLFDEAGCIKSGANSSFTKIQFQAHPYIRTDGSKNVYLSIDVNRANKDNKLELELQVVLANFYVKLQDLFPY